MKKIIFITLIPILGFVGFLIYDWHVKTTIQEDDLRITLYSWTDKEGNKHFTDSQPPEEARNVEEHKGYQYVDQPLVVKIKNRTMNVYQWAKDKLFKKKERKNKKR